MWIRVHFIKTDNASDISNGAEFRCVHLYSSFLMKMSSPCKQYQVCCFAHVLNLPVNGGTEIIHSRRTKIRSWIGCLQSSVNRRNLFYEFKVVFGLKIELSRLEVDTCCPSTFTLVKEGFLARLVLSARV